MGVAASAQKRITRAGIPAGAREENIYAGWYYGFMVLFGLLALAVITGVVLDSSVSNAGTTIVIAMVIGLVLWHWFYGQWHLITSDAHAVIYLLGNVAAITVCIRIWESSALLLFAVYWLGFAYLFTRYALVYALILTISTQWAFGTVGSNIGWNQDTLIAAVVLVLLLGFSGMMARYIEAFQNEAERNKALLAELKRTQQSLVESEREASVEQERLRMAGEIHDTLAQHFASVITNLRAANELEGKDSGPSRQHLENAFSAAQQGLTDSRAMLSTMQPDVLLGRTLGDVVQSIVAEWNQAAGDRGELSIEGQPGEIRREREMLIVRALQESLRNIDKHAYASKTSVRLTWLEDEVLLDVTDNGVGFNPETVEAGKDGYRMGLSTMQSRVESAGGTFALESAPGEGTSITISFPTGSAT